MFYKVDARSKSNWCFMRETLHCSHFVVLSGRRWIGFRSVFYEGDVGLVFYEGDVGLVSVW